MTVLQNASDVLRLFGSGCTDLTVSEVTTRLDMPKANASRLLKAMRDAGMLETIGDSRRHRPGRMMLDLAAAFRNSLGVIGRAGEVVAEVTRRFGHTGYVSLREGREVTAVADFPGSNDLRVVSNIGRRLTAHGSATGRTLLARLSRRRGAGALCRAAGGGGADRAARRGPRPRLRGLAARKRPPASTRSPSRSPTRRRTRR